MSVGRKVGATLEGLGQELPPSLGLQVFPPPVIPAAALSALEPGCTQTRGAGRLPSLVPHASRTWASEASQGSR